MTITAEELHHRAKWPQGTFDREAAEEIISLRAELAALAAQKPSVMVVGKLGAGIRGVCISGSPRPDVGAELFTRAAPAGVVVPKEDIINLWHTAHVILVACRGEFSEIPTVAPGVDEFNALHCAVQKMRDAVIEANKKAGE